MGIVRRDGKTFLLSSLGCTCTSYGMGGWVGGWMEGMIPVVVAGFDKFFFWEGIGG